MIEWEPVLAAQEQGVVYLFSRYWKNIPGFKDRWLYDIQIRFPDASMENTSNGQCEAIEFEYALSSFNHYTARDRKQVKDYDAIWIVYWDKDDDEKNVRDRIVEKLRIKRNKIWFLNLSDWFSPRVHRGKDSLETYWRFCKNKRQEAVNEVYSLGKIKDDTAEMAKRNEIELLDIKQFDRTIGFNRLGADFVECDHWRAIHLFTTTTRFSNDAIPNRLFVKPTGCGYFWGYFEIVCAFRIKQEKSARIRDYFKNYYFFPFDESVREICFVTTFQELQHQNANDPGVKLYNDLIAQKVRLDVRGSKIIPAQITFEMMRTI